MSPSPAKAFFCFSWLCFLCLFPVFAVWPCSGRWRPQRGWEHGRGPWPGALSRLPVSGRDVGTLSQITVQFADMLSVLMSFKKKVLSFVCEHLARCDLWTLSQITIDFADMLSVLMSFWKNGDLCVLMSLWKILKDDKNGFLMNIIICCAKINALGIRQNPQQCQGPRTLEAEYNVWGRSRSNYTHRWSHWLPLNQFFAYICFFDHNIGVFLDFYEELDENVPGEFEQKTLQWQHLIKFTMQHFVRSEIPKQIKQHQCCLRLCLFDFPSHS